MNARTLLLAAVTFLGGVTSVSAWGDERHLFPQGATVSTLIATPLPVEGMTGDSSGNLYVPGRQLASALGVACPVWRVNIAKPALVLVGNIPAPSPTTVCAPLGLAFDQGGKLYVGDGDKIYRFTPDAGFPPTATVFASGVPGANGLAFDDDGNLWTSDGVTGQGRVWRINAGGVVTEMFRIQPMANEVNLVGTIGGVGRDIRNLPLGTIDVQPNSRNAANTLGSQPLVANGLAFDKHGDLFVADTARGALWKVKLDRRGNVQSRMGCDTTFTPNTLCLENVFVVHPLLEGADGIALDQDGNIWVDANERNAIVVVTDKGKLFEVWTDKGNVFEVFRNLPDATTKLRNVGPLEFNTSPVLSDRRFCTSNSDTARRDNVPNTAGEVSPAGPNRGKISCIDQRLPVRGVNLPVR